MANIDIQLDLNQDQAGQVVQQNVPAGAQTTLAFRVEESLIPDFWGQKAKDTITAIIFIRKIDDLARSNNWNDTTTYANVATRSKGLLGIDSLPQPTCWIGQKLSLLGQT